MSSSKSHAEKTSAADKSIGFDYQYYYFLLKALNLKVGQSVGLEVQDDVHTTLDQSTNIFYQLKHTTKTDADGNPVALTRLDKDLWKTLYNWTMVITDKHCNRTSDGPQLEFTRNSEFHLVANKSINSQNSLVNKITQFQNRQIDLDDARKELSECRESTSDPDIQNYIKTVEGLHDSVLAQFFYQIRFELKLDDIKHHIKNSIIEFHVDSDKVEEVFSAIDSNLRSKIFDTVKLGKPVILTFEAFHKNYRKHFQDARSTKLSTTAFNPTLPSDIFSQLFIKRLIEIDAIDATDEEEAERLTLLKLQLTGHLDHWEKHGEITSKDKTLLEDDVKALWIGMFKLRFRRCPDDKIEEIGRGILGEMLKAAFKLSDDILSIPHSNGEVYYLADLGDIGWHKHWATK